MDLEVRPVTWMSPFIRLAEEATYLCLVAQYDKMPGQSHQDWLNQPDREYRWIAPTDYRQERMVLGELKLVCDAVYTIEQVVERLHLMGYDVIHDERG